MKTINIVELKQMNDIELRLLKNTVIDLLKDRRDISIINTRSQVVEGMKVTVDHKKLAGFDCEVVKINRKKVIISCSKGKFTVPMSLLILD